MQPTQPTFPPQMQPPAQPTEHRGVRTRTILLIAAAVLLTVLACGQCAFDIGVTYNIGVFSKCIYPPHVCTRP